MKIEVHGSMQLIDPKRTGPSRCAIGNFRKKWSCTNK